MNIPPALIREDFDRIARAAGDGWDHNRHFHRHLLNQLPAWCETALDIGSGTGAFTRLLASRCRRVVGLDFSPEMVRVARQRAREHSNIEFVLADALTWEYPPCRFDFVVSIATLHHLPLAVTLERMARTTKPGGVVCVVDLYTAATLNERLASALSVPVALLLRLLHGALLLETPEVRGAWRAHGEHDRYPTLRSVEQAAAGTLPGAVVRRHLLWRYSIVWRKPARQDGDSPESPRVRRSRENAGSSPGAGGYACGAEVAPRMPARPVAAQAQGMAQGIRDAALRHRETPDEF